MVLSKTHQEYATFFIRSYTTFELNSAEGSSERSNYSSISRIIRPAASRMVDSYYIARANLLSIVSIKPCGINEVHRIVLYISITIQ